MAENKVLGVLRKWFPGHAFGDLHDLRWNELTIIKHPDVSAIIANDARKNVDKIESALNQAYAAMRNLPPEVLRAMEEAHRSNAQSRLETAPRTATRDRLHGVDTKKEVEVIVPAQQMLTRLILGLSGDWPTQSNAPKARRKAGISAYKAAQRAITDMTHANDQEAGNDTWAKVALVENARVIWGQYSGKSALMKKLNPETPFANFLADLIEALGKDWQPEPTFNAWAKRKKVDS